MIIREGEYEIDRGRLMQYAELAGILKRLATKDLFSNMKNKGSHSITTRDVLIEIMNIPGYLFDNVRSIDSVMYRHVKVVPYKKENNNNEISN